eukprot:5604724-Pleurochrysis_carterae.AAC.1
MLGTDNDGNLFSLRSSIDNFSETDDADSGDDSAHLFGKAEMNAVTIDVDNTSTPASDDWQLDLFGFISPPVSSAHAAWTATRSTCAQLRRDRH